MWQAPNRPKGEITQSYNDGVVTIYSVTDGAQPGYQPAPVLAEKIVLRYEERRMGLQRYYQAMQDQVKIERVLRTPRAGGVTSQDVAITEDGRRYRVYMVQAVTDVYPTSVDITLSTIDQGVAHDLV